MKRFILLLALASASLSGVAHAQQNQPLMFGGSVGIMKPHGNNNGNGVNIGGRISRNLQDNIYWEADVNLGLVDGELDTQRDWSVNSLAGYAVYRTDGPTHLKAKLGVALWDDDFDSDTSLSAGIGIGFRMGVGILDVEYTQINSYIDYVTVGYSMPF
ncbi:MAG: outer membrane beta-barrel protein [Burkholderiales bacterium]